jgi:hypothetical protein
MSKSSPEGLKRQIMEACLCRYAERINVDARLGVLCRRWLGIHLAQALQREALSGDEVTCPSRCDTGSGRGGASYVLIQRYRDGHTVRLAGPSSAGSKNRIRKPKRTRFICQSSDGAEDHNAAATPKASTDLGDSRPPLLAAALSHYFIIMTSGSRQSELLAGFDRTADLGHQPNQPPRHAAATTTQDHTHLNIAGGIGDTTAPYELTGL